MLLNQTEIKIIAQRYCVPQKRVQNYAHLYDTRKELYEELENWNDSHLVDDEQEHILNYYR